MKDKIRIAMLVRKTMLMLDSVTPPNDLALATFRSDLNEAVRLISEEIERRDGYVAFECKPCFCVTCSFPLNDGAKFCPGCGFKVTENAVTK